MTYNNTLSVLALKTAPDVFDLSSGLVHVSVRDQIVRARLLVRDLHAAMPARNRILIVGAGTAGVAAACAAAARGFDVLVLDTRREPISLQGSTKTRYIGPFMYEWPAVFHADQHYPGVDPRIWPSAASDCPRWGALNPVSGFAFAEQIREWLLGWLAATHVPPYKEPVFLMNVDEGQVSSFVKDKFVPAAIAAKGQIAGVTETFLGKPWPGTSVTGSHTFTPDFVFLAAGMGSEETVLPGVEKVSGPPFWSDAPLGSMDQDLAVFGAGDGAIQDVLRAVTNFDHPLEFIAHLQRSPGMKSALKDVEEQLASIESQHRLSATWTSDKSAHEYVDDKCRAVACQLLPKAVSAIHRSLRKGKGKVWLISDDRHITKAYMLNRFVFHLVRLCIELHPPSRRRGVRSFEWVRGANVTEARRFGDFVQVRLTGHPSLMVDFVAVRWGLSKAEDAGPSGLKLIGINERKKAKRTTFAQVPLPYVLA